MIYDSNSKYRLFVEDYLSANCFVEILDHAATYKEAKEYLLSNHDEYDAILLDLKLPDREGEELNENMIKLASSIAIIVLSGFSDMLFSVRTLEKGGDYFIKDNLSPYAL